MPFLYETHMHTCQGSACGKATGREQARVYKDAEDELIPEIKVIDASEKTMTNSL